MGFGGFPKLGTLLGAPIIRIIIFWCLFWGSPILADYHHIRCWRKLGLTSILLLNAFDKLSNQLSLFYLPVSQYYPQFKPYNPLSTLYNSIIIVSIFLGPKKLNKARLQLGGSCDGCSKNWLRGFLCGVFLVCDACLVRGCKLQKGTAWEGLGNLVELWEL